jgi:hypothetical protein
MGRSVQQTIDGGFIIAGFTTSFGADSSNIYLIKTDSLGDTSWTRTYGGNNIDGSSSVQQTLDGGYIIAGWTTSFGAGSSDYYLVKTDSIGDTLWTRTYGNTAGDEGHYVRQTMDKGYIVTGWSSRGIYLVKTDSLGDTLWTNTYLDSSALGADSRTVQQTVDGGYFITGFLSSGGNSRDVYLIKVDSLGNILWTRTYGDSLDNVGFFGNQTSDGGFVITGWTYSLNTGGYDVYLIKTDSFGDTLWTRTYGGTNKDRSLSVQQTLDGGYIISGHTFSIGAGGADVYLIKTNSSGDTLWTKTFGGSAGENGYSIQQTLDGGYIIVGYTESFGAGHDDVYLIKTDSNGMVVGVEEEDLKFGVRNAEFGMIQNQPNPFNKLTAISYTLPGLRGQGAVGSGKDKIHVRLTIYDITGRLVEILVNEHQEPGVYQVYWDGRIPDSGVRSGIYFYRLQSGNYTNTKKLILLK